MIEGRLTRNDIGRWEFANHELKSGDAVEILIAEHWVRGRVEFMHGTQSYELIVSSGPDSETYLILHVGMYARSPGEKIRPYYP